MFKCQIILAYFVAYFKMEFSSSSMTNKNNDTLAIFLYTYAELFLYFEIICSMELYLAEMFFLRRTRPFSLDRFFFFRFAFLPGFRGASESLFSCSPTSFSCQEDQRVREKSAEICELYAPVMPTLSSSWASCLATSSDDLSDSDEFILSELSEDEGLPTSPGFSWLPDWSDTEPPLGSWEIFI